MKQKLQLKYSFGYDCKRRGNLQLLDTDTLAFVAGNILVLLEMKTKQQHYIHSSRGGGIGAIMPHPSRNYLVVAEKGNQPDIIIYEYPSLQIYRKLRGGTDKAYSCINFDHDGTLLASVGGAPDYMLTVWDWNQEHVVLRCKAFSQDIYRVTFSPDNPGQLTTSGSGHIKFWKMANTFTGLKLNGMLGRFGKTPLTDIEGYIELPDGKVVSGSEWGNMLLWDGDLIKVEIGRKGGNTCHAGPIQQFVLDEGELITVGADGVIRTWDFETIDAADCMDDRGLFEMDPMNELNVGRNVSLSYMVRSIDPASTVWFAQDSNGGIWKLDLSFCNTTMEPELLFSFHAGEIEGMDVSGFSQLMATTALDGSVRIYDFLSNKEVTVSQYRQGGSSLIWVPRTVPGGENVLAVGFDSGVVRLLELCKSQNVYAAAGGSVTQLRLKQAFKPHNASVTAISYNHDGKKMATGSLEGTVFFFSVGDLYEPIGFVKVPGPVQGLQWAPPSHKRNALLVMCQMDHVVEVEAPEIHGPGNTYHLPNLPIRHFRFQSIKSRVKRDEELSRRQALRETRKSNDTHQEQDVTDEEDLPPIFIPSGPSPLHCAFYSTQPGAFWLSVFSEEQSADTSEKRDEPFAHVPVQDADHNPILTVFFCQDRRLLLCGMQDGSIRVYPLESDDLQPVHMQEYWVLAVHDNQYGRLRQLRVSHDGRFVLSTGADGNIFSFSLMEGDTVDVPQERFAHVPTSHHSVDKNSEPLDIDDPDAYSIETAKQKQELDRMYREAESRKLKRREKIAELRSGYQAMLKQNERLLEHVRVQPLELMLDCCFREEIKRQTAAKVNEVKRELAWDMEKWNIALRKIQERFVDPVVCDIVVVSAIQSDLELSTYKLRALPKNRYQMKEEDETERRAEPDTLQPDRHTKQEDTPPAEVEADHTVAAEETKPHVPHVACSKLAARRAEKLHKAAEKLEKARAAIERRKREWDELYAAKPSEDYEDPEDIRAIQEARENMGVFKLKTAKDFKASPQQRMNRVKKTKQIMTLEDLIFEMKDNMNMRVLALRDSKVALVSQLHTYMQQLHAVQKLLPAEKHRTPPSTPTLMPQETPEKEVQVSLPKLEHCTAALGQTAFKSWDDKFSRLHQMMQKDTDEETCVEEETTDLDEEETTDTEENLTELEKEVMEVEEIRSLYQQDKLIKQMEEAVCIFDAQLRLLRHDKLHLDPRLKLAELRCITLFQELQLIQEFEERERALEKTLHTRVQEERDIQMMVEESKCQLEVRTRDLTKLQERKKALLETLKTSLGENKFADFLTKVFKKNIKRVKAQETLGREERSDAPSEETDRDSDDEEDEEDDDDDDDEVDSDDSSCCDYSVCPAGCNPQLYEQIVSLREQRLDIDELLKEHSKTVDSLKHEYNIITKKLKVVQSNRKTAEDNLDLLNREKQQKVNDLDVVVPLRLHQIQYVNREMPSDLSAALVINSASLSQLEKRIKELHQEKSDQKERSRQARQHHVQLRQELRDKQDKTQKLQAQCDKMMLDKFGKLVDLDALQMLSSDQKVQEKKNEKEEKEARNSKTLNVWKGTVADAEMKLTTVNQEYSARLRRILSLKKEKQQLEDQLSRRNKHP